MNVRVDSGALINSARDRWETAAFDPKFVAVSAFGALVVNTLALVVLIFSGSNSGEIFPETPKTSRNRCGEDRRCGFGEVSAKRRPIDAGQVPELDFIEVAIIPKLGLKEPVPNELPKLVKYEQPEIIEEAINIEEETPPEPKELKMEPVPKPQELDKRRKVKTLDDILNAPRDDDPRKRPTALNDIIGTPIGLAEGTDPLGKEMNAAIAKLQVAIGNQFILPPSLPDASLMKLSLSVKLKIKPDGTIEEYNLVRKSQNPQFDSAAIATFKRFMPKEGGSARLPELPPDVVANINSGKIALRLDGKLFRR
ncbi:MAG: TonB C-terminal domain-containing protein [Myxococcales bacterium]|nr:TonB C-terminal domain-containing protein [Myxococcales bacterium]